MIADSWNTVEEAPEASYSPWLIDDAVEQHDFIRESWLERWVWHSQSRSFHDYLGSRTPRAVEQAFDAVWEPVSQAIRDAKRLIELSDNWDGEGSPGFSTMTLARATNLVRDTVLYLWTTAHIQLSPPEFLPTSDGSIDIEWYVGDKELVLRIPVDPNERVAFYGKSSSDFSIRGTFSEQSSDRSWLLSWVRE